MVSFQLFVLECYKVQDDFRKQMDKANLQIEPDFAIKVENSNAYYDTLPMIKSEVSYKLL